MMFLLCGHRFVEAVPVGVVPVHELGVTGIGLVDVFFLQV